MWGECTEEAACLGVTAQGGGARAVGTHQLSLPPARGKADDAAYGRGLWGGFNPFHQSLPHWWGQEVMEGW